MTNIVLLFVILIVLASIVLLIRPDFIFGIFTKYGDSPGLHLFAVIVRLLMGVALVMAASDSRYPLALQVFGWLLIFVALLLAVIGRENFKKTIAWSLTLAPAFQRLGGVLGISIGCFLAYAVI